MIGKFSYILYVALCAILGWLLSDGGITPYRWQFWVLLVIISTIYICGYVRGRTVAVGSKEE